MAPPLLYDEETGDRICALIIEGLSLRAICREHPEMPARSTINKWLSLNEAFADQYAKACEMRAEEVFEEILDIADDGTNDWMERNGKDGETGDTVLNGEHVQRSRLRIDARKWALSKMIPKKYGDKIDTSGNHTFNVTIDKDDAGL